MPDVQPFAVQFGEAIDYLKGKLPEASLAWDSLAGPVHAKVFTVAGATSADLAGEIQASLQQALASGSTITAFRKDFDRIVQSHGWTYKGSRGWRTSVIFDTNMRSAHMAGRWAQIEANKEQRPFLQYRTAGDARVRPQHRAWDGKIYAVDDAFWHTHYPPNGWGCRCTVRSYGAAEMARKGLQVSKPIKPQVRDVVNRDGVITDRVPVGIDPGWDHNVGQSWIDPELALGRKLAALPRELRGPLVDKTISPAFEAAMNEGWKSFRSDIAAGRAPVSGQAQAVGFLDSATLDALATRVPALTVETSTVAVLDAELGALQAGGAWAAAWPAELVDQLPSALRNYRAVLWDAVDERLVVVPQAGVPSQGLVPVAVLAGGVRTSAGPTWSLQALAMVAPGDLGNAGRYRVLVGRVR